MMKAPVLDTHIWVWWMHQDPDLSGRYRDALENFDLSNRPYLSAISLWEVATLVDLGRIRLDLPLKDWFRLAAHPNTVRLIPISPEIAAECAQLPDTFHRDPADRLIVATARLTDRPLSTLDKRIRQSRLCRLWKP